MAAAEIITPELTETISVWLVDDDVEFSFVAVAALSLDSGITCECSFGTCEAAIEALRQADRKPDVILLDIDLPGMNGLDAIEPLKSISPSTHIVMLTIYDRDRNIMRAVAAGASGYLLKASRISGVVNAIHATMSGGIPMHAQIVQRLLHMFAVQDLPKIDKGITSKEKEILWYIIDGLTNESVAAMMGISINTVDTHLKNIYSKLDVHTRSALATKILKEDLI